LLVWEPFLVVKIPAFLSFYRFSPVSRTFGFECPSEYHRWWTYGVVNSPKHIAVWWNMLGELPLGCTAYWWIVWECLFCCELSTSQIYFVVNSLISCLVMNCLQCLWVYRYYLYRKLFVIICFWWNVYDELFVVNYFNWCKCWWTDPDKLIRD
jgi:hypothetical protein